MGALRGFDMREYVMFLVEFRQGAVSVARVFDPGNPMKATTILKRQLHLFENNEHFMV